MKQMQHLFAAVILIFFAVSMATAQSSECGNTQCWDSSSESCKARGWQNRWAESFHNNSLRVWKWCRIPSSGHKAIVFGGAECFTGGGWIKNGQSWTNNATCDTYTCRYTRADGQVHVSMIPSSFGCKDRESGECKTRGYQNKWARYYHNGTIKIWKWCRIPKSGSRSTVFAYSECLTDGGWIRNGQSWTNDTTCYTYKCRFTRGESVTASMKAHSFGCPHPSENRCVHRGQLYLKEGNTVRYHYRCIHRGPRDQEIRAPRYEGHECRYNDTWYRPGEKYTLGPNECLHKMCPTKRWVASHNNIIRNPLFYGKKRCYDRASGTCKDRGYQNAWNVTSGGFKFVHWCKITESEENISMRIIIYNGYCPYANAPDGFVKSGHPYKDMQRCKSVECIMTTTERGRSMSMKSSSLPASECQTASRKRRYVEDVYERSEYMEEPEAIVV